MPRAGAPVILDTPTRTLEAGLEDAQLAPAGRRLHPLVAALAVHDHLLLPGSFGVLHCYFEVCSEHFGGVLFEARVGELYGELALVVLLAGVGEGGVLFGGGGVGVVEFALLDDFAADLLEGFLLVDVHLAAADLVLELLRVLEDEHQLTVARYDLGALGGEAGTYSGLDL